MVFLFKLIHISFLSSKDGELNEERKEYEDFRRKLQHQLTSLHNELDTQRRELTAGDSLINILNLLETAYFTSERTTYEHIVVK